MFFVESKNRCGAAVGAALVPPLCRRRGASMSTPAAPLPLAWHWLAPFFSGLILLGRRLPALLITLLFLAITWLGVGQDFDVPGLIWEESVGRQFFIGVAVAMLMGYLWTITYLVDGQ